VTYEGACHCGSVMVWFETSQAADDIQVRADQCGFCRRQGAKSISDPKGWLEFRAAPGSLRRYQFGLKSADFLICGECGTYMGAVTSIGSHTLGVLNVVGADIRTFAHRDADPVDYDDEDLAQRNARRLERWTPCAVVEANPDA
jgi:hypothetical protein